MSLKRFLIAVQHKVKLAYSAQHESLSISKGPAQAVIPLTCTSPVNSQQQSPRQSMQSPMQQQSPRQHHSPRLSMQSHSTRAALSRKPTDTQIKFVLKSSSVYDAVFATSALKDKLCQEGTLHLDDVLSQYTLFQRHVHEIDSPGRLHDLLYICSEVIGNDNDDAVTKLVISALERLACLPNEVWAMPKTQDHLRWVLYRSAQCKCTTEQFNRKLPQIIDTSCIEKITSLDTVAHNLLLLNIASADIATRLIERYRYLALTSRRSLDPRPPYNTPKLLLYATLCEANTQPLVDLMDIDRFLSECRPSHAQYLISLNTLSPTMDQRKKVVERLMESFLKISQESPNSNRAFNLLSYLVGKQYATGRVIVGGFRASSVCIFDRELQPINLQNTDCPLSVYDKAAGVVTMDTAKKHGYTVVACLGLSEKTLLRHPQCEPNGYEVLEASALKATGCYVVPIRLRPLRGSNAPGQIQFETIPALCLNYPHHIPNFQ